MRPTKTIPSLAVSSIVLLVWAIAPTAFLGCKNRLSEGTPMIEVFLCKDVESLSGHVWARKADDATKRAEMCKIEGPCDIKVSFPSGHSYTCWAKLVVMSQSKEKICRVSISTLEKRVDFSTALCHADRIVRELKIEDDKQIREKLNEWRQRAPGFSVSLRKVLEKDVSVFMDVRQDASNREAYDVILTFSCLGD